MAKYNSAKIESKWQKYWQAKKAFQSKDVSRKPKKYVLVEFPYPSGAGLHMGHLRPYVAADVYSRYFRMKGFEVMFPIGWDAFGLPAENFAIKNGVHPKVSTARNVKNAKAQLQSWGVSFDWSREVNTTDPEYYRWTQWIFLQFYKAGLAYEATGLINWCPKDKTGLANEEVVDGKCERCGTEVEKKELRQWYLKITEYAEKLLEGLKTLDRWPEAVKVQQENWIGKSVGGEIEFPLKDTGLGIKVFTTRPDTIFGATYMVLAPEHPAVELLKEQITNYKEVRKYVESTAKKKEMERTAEGKEKTGVKLEGVAAINPATNQEIPVYIADYVLWGYGTGAIMAVPAHDQRDFEFAKKYELPIVKVIDNGGEPAEAASAAYGILVNSGEFTGLKSEDAIPKMAEKFGKLTATYKLRDWVFSRQRYWGEPIPLIHCEQCGIVPVPDKDLPVKLPPVKKYEPTGTGESPLAAIKSWVNVRCPKCKGKAKRETNTMPQWAGSSWYWLRYADPKNRKAFADKKKLSRWTPVDVYFGGMEHTTLHLLYSRFWNLFLYDKKLVTAKEPYLERRPHGIVLGPDGEKMSKSRGNVVNPDDVVKRFGADTLRMYELFLGPHETMVAWNDQGIIGIRRFLDRVWAWAQELKDAPHDRKAHPQDSEKVEIQLNKLTKKITEDIENFRFNTAISAFMEFHNQVRDEFITLDSVRKFLRLLCPFAPHFCEEMHAQLGGKKSLQLESWPTFDPAKLADKNVEMVVQINGKVRGKVSVPAGSPEDAVKAAVLNLEAVKKALTGESVKRVIFVPNRLINLVV